MGNIINVSHGSGKNRLKNAFVFYKQICPVVKLLSDLSDRLTDLFAERFLSVRCVFDEMLVLRPDCLLMSMGRACC